MRGEKERELEKRKKKEDCRKGRGEAKKKLLLLRKLAGLVANAKHKILCREGSERDDAHCIAGTLNSVPTQAQRQAF